MFRDGIEGINNVFETDVFQGAVILIKGTPGSLKSAVCYSFLSKHLMRFPEFGIDVEPGPAAESFVTNIEGILLRLVPVVESAIRFAEAESEKERGEEVLQMIEAAREGEFVFTIIFEDPAGISGILPDDLSLVKYEELTAEEASHLKGAPIWLDTVRDELQERKG